MNSDKYLKSFIGFLFIAAGILYLFFLTGLIPGEFKVFVTDYWPVLVILAGVYKVLESVLRKKSAKSKYSRIYWSLAVVISGVVLLENRLQIYVKEPINLWSVILAILIIYIGTMIMFFKSGTFIIGDGNINLNFGSNDKNGDFKNIEIEIDESIDDDIAGESGDRSKEEYVNQDRSRENAGSSSTENEESHQEKHYSGKEKKSKEYYKNYAKSQNNFVGELRLGDHPWSLENSDYSLGVGDVYVDFTTALLEEGTTKMNLSCWVGDMTLIIPDDMDLEVYANVNIGSVELFGTHKEFNKKTKKSAGITSNTVHYISENFENSEKRLVIKANVNIGEITVKKV